MSIPERSIQPRREFHIPSLDGLRAISFLIVFVSHAGGAAWGIPGGFGVTVFFFLSGYLITTLLRLEFEQTARVSLRDFYLRRVLRILPPFYTVLAFAVVMNLVGLTPGHLQTWPMLAQLLHFTNYWSIFHGTEGQPAGTGVYWSLAVEEHFYLVFPAVFLLLQRLLPRRGRAQGAVLLALCGAVLAWRCWLVLGAHAPENRTFYGTDTRLDSILFGCALAVAANPMLDAPRVPSARLRQVWFPLGLAGLIAGFVLRAPWFRETFRYSLQGLALMPVFVAAMREPDWGPFRLLNTRLLKRVGVLSYSLYLVHQVVLMAAEHRALAPLPRAVVALGVSLVLAELTQRYVERPCARLRKRLMHTDWQAARPPQASSAS
ncbi:MAG: acyltransferase [Deltaproteobacteria bacterium]|nr:acyltransferase [Deltaproteobacteria bacterium]